MLQCGSNTFLGALVCGRPVATFSTGGKDHQTQVANADIKTYEVQTTCLRVQNSKYDRGTSDRNLPVTAGTSPTPVIACLSGSTAAHVCARSSSPLMAPLQLCFREHQSCSLWVFYFQPRHTAVSHRLHSGFNHKTAPETAPTQCHAEDVCVVCRVWTAAWLHAQCACAEVLPG